MDVTEMNSPEGVQLAPISASFVGSPPSAEEPLSSRAARSHAEYKEPRNALDGKSPIIVLQNNAFKVSREEPRAVAEYCI